MNKLRFLLFPFALLYYLITRIRNFLYDNQIFKSKSFDIPTIVVGNISVGGTGKTPHVEYLIRLLSDDYKIATLSRGYKRKSKGFVLADKKADATTIGDEPFQYFNKFKNINVSVDNDRCNGISNLLNMPNKPEIILLDDAYQHRKLKAGFYILLTTYHDLFTDDFLLPTGGLREGSYGAKRADVIIVSKCPTDISEAKIEAIEQKLKLLPNQKIFFTYVEYDDYVYGKNDKINVEDIKKESKIILAGVAKSFPFIGYVSSGNDTIMKFNDHHFFTDSEINHFKNITKGVHKIVTTEKDYVRLMNSEIIDQLYYLPIKINFIKNKEQFNQTIKNYVGKNTRNSSIS